MSRGIAYRRGLVRSLLAVVVSVGASAWAGEKIEQTGVTTVQPASLSTNKSGKADEPSPSVLEFQKRINEMDSRFGWQGGLPGSRPNAGAARLPAPNPTPRRNSDKEDKNKDWLSAPANGELDYEASLGVTMFSSPKASATSAPQAASGRSPKPGTTQQPGNPSLAPGDADDPFNAQLQSYIRPDTIISPSFSGIGQSSGVAGFGRSPGLVGGGGIGAEATTGLPTELAPERTLDGILGRNVDRPQSSVPTVNSVLSGNPAPLVDPRRFETGVDTVLRQYRPAPTAIDSISKPVTPTFSSLPKAPTLDDILSSSSAGPNSLDADRRSRTVVEPSRGFLDPKNRPPAILPGPKSSFGGF